jgi:NAD-dependent SIR2 family protein deacetylase
LPEEAWNNSFQYIKNANLVIVIGTSLEVYPANELPFSTKGKTVLINLDESESEFDVKITGMAKDTLKKINDGLQLD